MEGISIHIQCHLCNSKDSNKLLTVSKKPEGETDYKISEADYYREVHHCKNCGVYFNARNPDLIPKDFYEGTYNESIVEGNLAKRFERIINLPFSNSDNKNRVLRLVNFLYEKDILDHGMKVLDVGSGTCVFLHEMKKFGFETYSLDPDPSSAKHSEETVKVTEAYCGTLDALPKEKRFDLITFNKVLEHVEDPISVLKQAKEYLLPEGMIYVELPEGEKIAKQEIILNRAEFYIDHHTVFSTKSFAFLVNAANLRCENIIKIMDPSGKSTILGLCSV